MTCGFAGKPGAVQGRDYIYRYPGIHRTFDLLRYGRDGRPGGTSEDSDLSL